MIIILYIIITIIIIIIIIIFITYIAPFLYNIRKRITIVYLTNKFHVAVRLFSNRSQMTSKHGKNKNVAHEAIAECVTDVLTTF